MTIPIQVRGFTPRPWKSKTGVQNYSGTFVVLDTSPDRPVMDTIKVDKDFDGEPGYARAAQLVGKTAQLIVTNFRVGMDGTVHLLGEIEAATK